MTLGNSVARLAALTLAATAASPAWSGVYDLTVDRVTIDTGDFTRSGIGYNGASPGPVLRWKEGEEVTINVTNNLSEDTSIHWHGLILPYTQDGVPGVSYDGIKPGETFTYNFPLVQAGTYWFHSHSGFQEPDGAYGAIVIEPKDREPFRYDRDYVVQLTDAHPHSGARIMRNLKTMPDYYNRQQRTLGDLIDDAQENGLAAALEDRRMWGEMRMMPTDVEDVQGFTPLINGKSPEQNWTALFTPGERVRLRFINSSAMAYFDIRIPGLKMSVVQADGNNVQPVAVDELRIAVAETYDVIVFPREDRAYTIFAESAGRTAYARGTLAPREGMEAEVPALREPPLLTMADMSLDPAMAGMHDMPMGEMAMAEGTVGADDEPLPPGAHRMPDGSIMGGPSEDPFYAAGSGLKPAAAEPNGKFLSYADLRAQKPLYADREPDREIEVRLNGNMERYIWTINGVKHSESDPIVLNYGERVRFKFVNETMMTHPMHLHGMWSILDTGKGEWDPVKHVISVAPGTVVYAETEVDATGDWIMHCHLSYHMDAGMMRNVVVKGGPAEARAALDPAVRH
jgi:L-ascorbate oxidase